MNLSACKYDLRKQRYSDLGFELIDTFKALQHNICIELIDFDYYRTNKSGTLDKIKEEWYNRVDAIIDIAAETLITKVTPRDETECASLDPDHF
ncbi:hypothetical protein TKK_0009990 [Trichogramma kaykai]